MRLRLPTVLLIGGAIPSLFACNALLGNSEGTPQSSSDSDAADAAILESDGGIGGGACGDEACSIASGLSQPSALAFDDTYVYWASTSAFQGMARAPKNGGGAVLPIHASADGKWIGVDALNMYWTSASRIYRRSTTLDDTAPITEIVSDSKEISAVTLSSGNLVWASDGNVRTCKVPECSSPKTLATLQGDVVTVVATPDRAQWGLPTAVRHCALAGSGCGDAPGAYPFGGTLLGLTGDKQATLYSVRVTSISKCTLTTCAFGAVQIATSPEPFALAVDDANVWWRDRQNYDIYRCEAEGCKGVPTIVTEGQFGEGAHSLASNGGYLYWTTGTEVRRAKFTPPAP